MKPRLSTIALSVALVVAVLAAAAFYLGRNAERAKRIWVEDQLARVTAAREELAKERNELADAKEALEAQLGDLTQQAKALSDQLAQEKRARTTLTNQLAETQQEVASLREQVDSERQEKQTITEELARAKQSYQALSNELTTLRQAKEALEKRVKEMLAARVREAEQIVVKPKPEETSRIEAVEGKVLVVNREFNFVVVNLGTQDEIAKGNRLEVLRDGQRVGLAEVDRIYENMSSANIVQEETPGPLQAGDTVRLLG